MERRQAFPAPGHDHRACVTGILSHAEEICARRKARLTEQRRRVLEIIAVSHAAIGAYDILDQMAGPEGRPAPVIVYRALDFLIAQGLVHRLESLNAFVACARPSAAHGAQFLICGECGTVAEMDQPAIGVAIRDEARKSGFVVEAPVIEISGICAHCSRDGTDGH